MFTFYLIYWTQSDSWLNWAKLLFSSKFNLLQSDDLVTILLKSAFLNC